jgi:two-component system, cell cycle sensor histidine kinase and response regulator CckA
MKTEIRVLILEDNSSDAELIKRELRKSGRSFALEHASDREAYIRALENFLPDIILTDYRLPQLDGMEAMRLARSRFQSIPVVIVSGAIGEEAAIETLKGGATDYVLKDKLAKVIPAMDRAIAEARMREEGKKAEEAIRDQADLLRLSFDAIIVSRLHGPIETWNLGAENLYGYSEGEAIGRTPKELLSTTLPAPWSEIEGVIRKAGQWEGELRHKQKNGTEITVQARLQLVTRPGHGEFILEINRDITQRKLAEEVLKRDKETLENLIRDRTEELFDAKERMERAKRLSDIGVLAATVAHELRNPLAAINMATHNIKRKSNNPDLEKHIGTINKKINESNQIINNLLYYSRIRPPEFESVRIADILEETIEANIEKHAKGVTVTRALTSIANTCIEADPTQLKEVFNNILNNAFDAISEEKGEISIVSENEASIIRLLFKDNGIGIEPEHFSRIFSPFFTTKAKGTGLGLSVCKQILSLHDGDISIESESGKGTVVTLLLRCREKRYDPAIEH